MSCTGFHTHCEDSLMESLDYAVSKQADAVQIFLGSGHKGFPDPKFQRAAEMLAFKDRKRELGIQVVVHHNYITNLADPRKAGWAMKSAKEALKVAHILGVDYFVVHTGSHKDLSVKDGLVQLTKNVDKMLGWNYDPIICLENGAGGGTQVGHIPNLLQVIQANDDPRLKLCLDTAHAYADGHQMDNGKVRAKIFQEVMPYLGMVHWNNPDPQVKLGGHLDRHKVSWADGVFDPRIMTDMMGELDGFPLIMEAAGEAVSANLDYLREQEERARSGKIENTDSSQYKNLKRSSASALVKELGCCD